MSEFDKLTLEDLRPVENPRIIDMVEAAGVDVSGWWVKADGSPVNNPAANPHYCYEWAYGGGEQPIVLCIWHALLQSDERGITCSANLRKLALQLEVKATEPWRPSKDKSRANSQAKRARKFDSLVQQAYRRGLQLRVVIVDGVQASDDQIGLDSSKVESRQLDIEPWRVEKYFDESGDFLLLRSSGVSVKPPERQSPPEYVDQFSPEGPVRRTSTTEGFVRSTEVRQKALERSEGACELCLTPGFITDNGSRFLETHHVVPLSDGGPDAIFNVVALCPNDHRRAHYSRERAEIAGKLLAHLESYYPVAVKGLRASRCGP